MSISFLWKKCLDAPVSNKQIHENYSLLAAKMGIQRYPFECMFREWLQVLMYFSQSTHRLVLSRFPVCRCWVKCSKRWCRSTTVHDEPWHYCTQCITEQYSEREMDTWHSYSLLFLTQGNLPSHLKWWRFACDSSDDFNTKLWPTIGGSYGQGPPVAIGVTTNSLTTEDSLRITQV